MDYRGLDKLSIKLCYVCTLVFWFPLWKRGKCGLLRHTDSQRELFWTSSPLICRQCCPEFPGLLTGPCFPGVSFILQLGFQSCWEMVEEQRQWAASPSPRGCTNPPWAAPHQHCHQLMSIHPACWGAMLCVWCCDLLAAQIRDVFAGTSTGRCSQQQSHHNNASKPVSWLLLSDGARRLQGCSAALSACFPAGARDENSLCAAFRPWAFVQGSWRSCLSWVWMWKGCCGVAVVGADGGPCGESLDEGRKQMVPWGNGGACPCFCPCSAMGLHHHLGVTWWAGALVLQHGGTPLVPVCEGSGWVSVSLPQGCPSASWVPSTSSVRPLMLQSPRGGFLGLV